VVIRLSNHASSSNQTQRAAQAQRQELERETAIANSPMIGEVVAPGLGDAFDRASGEMKADAWRARDG